jgi:hypothetical protein
MDGAGFKSHSTSAQVGLKTKKTKWRVSADLMTLGNGAGYLKLT